MSDTANQLIKAVSDFRYHRRHEMEAARALANIEGQKGRLASAVREQADKYARDVLGWHGFAPWLYVYSAIAGEFRWGWIPDNYYGKVVIPVIKGSYGDVASLKPLSRRVLNTDALPDIAYFVNGLFYTTSIKRIDEADLETVLFSDSAKIVFKIDNSGKGKGVSILEPHTFDLAEIKAGGNGVFQRYIDQHDFFSAFSPSSVATLRITTVVDNAGDCSVAAAYLRLGREQDTHVMSSSAIRVALDTRTGVLADTGYFPSWLTTDRHPDSKIEFAGKQIPSFAKCTATVVDLQRKMPYVRAIGWDISVSKNGDVLVMEWNGNHNDIKFSEATQGPCFRELHWEKLSMKGRCSPG